MCTYDNTQTEDQFDWLRNAGATSSWQTGPSVDHTLGTALGMKEGKKTLALIKKKIVIPTLSRNTPDPCPIIQECYSKKRNGKRRIGKQGTGNNTVTLSLVRFIEKKGKRGFTDARVFLIWGHLIAGFTLFFMFKIVRIEHFK